MNKEKKNYCKKCGQPSRKLIAVTGVKMFLFMALASFLTFIIISIQYPINFAHMVSAPSMHMYAQWSRGDPVVVNITNFCNMNMTPKEQVACVVSQVDGFFNYTFNDRSRYIIKSPEMVAETGGICRDYAVMYDSIFTNLGYETTYTFTDGHVFNVIYKDANDFLYCMVDQQTYSCSGGDN